MGDEDEFGVSGFRVLDPLGGALELRARFGEAQLKVLVDGGDVFGDRFWAAISEISLGHEAGHFVEGGEEFFGEGSADFGKRFGDFAFEFFGVDRFSVEEDFAGVAVELEDEGFFPRRPCFFVGAFGVGVGEKEEGIEAVLVAHDVGELLDHLGVVDIFFGGEAPEGEVVIDEKGDEGSSSAGDAKAGADAGGENGGAVDVFANVFGASGIVKEKGDKKSVGVGVF